MSTLPPETRRESPRELLTLMTARVRDAYVRQPLWLDGGLDLASACADMARQQATHALVRDGERTGIFTTTDLRDAIVAGHAPAQTALRDVARFELVGVEADAEVFEALWLMVRERVHRVVVREHGQVLGVLGQLDLLSFVARHSHIVALQIDQATTVEDLRVAALRIDESVAALHASGIPVERIARMVTEMNRRLMQRLWQMLAPPQLQADSCLLVMGSEGRGEQILKTDQDNALLLRDGADASAAPAVAREFSQALESFGYPPCPGGIMVREPAWRQTVGEFRATIGRWIYGGDPDGPMNLAIFLDAAPVAGDAALYDGLRAWLGGVLSDHQAFLARFAAAADQFREPGPWWRRLWSHPADSPIDLKKHGIFPIVHGVRALALQHGVLERGTVARVAALQAGGHLDAALGGELVAALHLLLALRLTHQLKARARGQPAANLVEPDELARHEREPLRQALLTVRAFRAHLRRHFNLDAL